MSDNTSGDNDARIFNFPRIGFNLTPTTTLPGPAAPPPPANPPTPAPAPLPSTTTAAGRRSPLDTLANLPDPGIHTPVLTPAQGAVPATFRNEPASDMTGPRLGALSLAACLAVAVAALRGTHTVLSTWWENRQARTAETDPLREARLKHQLNMQNIADKATQQRAKTNTKVPSSSEFGRKTLGGRSGKSGGGSSSGSSGGGSGRGRSPKSGNGSTGTGPGRGPKKPASLNRGPGRNSSGTGGPGGGRKHTPHSPKTPNTPKKPKTPKSPHRPSQGGSGAGLLKKQRTNTDTAAKKNRSKNQPPHGGRRTPLGDALTNGARKAADRRLKRRRKNGLDKPALWAGDTRTNRKGPKNAKDLKGRKDRSGKDSSPRARKTTPDSKNARGRKDGPDMKLGPTAWRDLRKAANRRWKRRQKRDGRTVPPLWRDVAAKNRKAKDTSATSPKAGTKAKGDAKAGGKPSGAPGDSRSQWWERARDYARKHGRGGDFFGGSDTADPGPQFTADPQSSAGAATGAGNDGAGPTPGSWNRQRSTPFQNAGQASGHSAWTVERDDHPGTQTKHQEPSPIGTSAPALPRTGPAALDAAPTPHTARPGTSRPKEPIAMPPAPVPARQDPRIVKARKQAARAAVQTVGRQMDAQHETEITLDDACDAADQLMDDGFKTHDQSARLSDHARRLREAWLVLADDCAANNNLTGALYTAAAIKFAESVELVARMADEMTISSLEAAEKSETAGNELNNAYRPITQATADAGLTTPSAPVHNEV